MNRGARKSEGEEVRIIYMGLLTLNEFPEILVCPRCSSAIYSDGASFRCSATSCNLAQRDFVNVGGEPAFIDFERSVLSEAQIISTSGSSVIVRDGQKIQRKLYKKLVHSKNPVTENNIRALIDCVTQNCLKPRVLIVGGGSIGKGALKLYESEDIDLLAFDIYASQLTQFIADAHQIPLADSSVNGVLIQAVLEHVLEPQKVVQEIHRVLRPGGVVYAETPFLQQVHEGPYDFTRFTESGHRYLFRDFSLIDSGGLSGPGTVLVWALDHFARSLFRSKTAGQLTRLMTSWLSFFDRFLDPRFSLDGASGVFFLGSKTTSRISPQEMVLYYGGSR